MYRLIARNVGGLVIVKALSMLQSLAAVPLAIRYFGGDSSRLASWFTTVSYLSILLTLDFGIGNRLKNDILGLGPEHVRRPSLIANAIRASAVIAVGVAVVVLLSWKVLGAGASVGSFGSRVSDSVVVTLLVILYILATPLRLSFFLLQASQRNALSAFVALVPQLAVLGVLVVRPQWDADALFLLLLFAFVTFSVISNGLGLLISEDLRRIGESLRSSANGVDADIRQAASMARSGMGFFAVQISILLLYGANEIFYSMRGTEDLVVSYQYFYRPFSLFFVGFSLLSLPFWSAIRAHVAAREPGKAVRLSKVLVLLLVPVAFALIVAVLYFQPVLDLWVGQDAVLADTSEVLGFALMALLVCASSALSAILNAFDVVGFQARVLGLSVAVKLLVLSWPHRELLSVDTVLMSSLAGLMLVVVLSASRTYRQVALSMHESEIQA